MCPNPQLIVINSFEMAGDKKVVALQEKLSTETEKFRGLQKDLQKCLASAQQLEAQLKENEVVKEELGLVKDDSKVYKLIGPVLVKQVCDISKKIVGFPWLKCLHSFENKKPKGHRSIDELCDFH